MSAEKSQLIPFGGTESGLYSLAGDLDFWVTGFGSSDWVVRKICRPANVVLPVA